jgi:AcrR family transcriptional regulator
MSYPAQVTREKILAQAVVMIEKKGALSLQDLARKLGIRAPSLYRYFDSRERLMAAVGLTGYRKLADFIRATTRRDPSLRAAAWAIRRFARKHPGLYRTMNETDARHEDPQEAREVTREVLAAAFGERVPDDRISSLGAALTSIRAFVHGFAMLEIAGQFQNERQLDRSFEAGLDALLAAFEAQLRS